MTMSHHYMFLAVFVCLALFKMASEATEACLQQGIEIMG